MVTKKSLQDRFARLLKRAGAKRSSTKLFQELYARYSEANRHYHNLRHLQHCLREWQRVPGRKNIAIGLALWFHDAVYDPRQKDNEVRSSDLAAARLSSLKVKQELIDDVVRLIGATTHKSEPTAADERLIVDIDLAILGQRRKAYDEYERAIRKEYSHVLWADFRKGRSEVLVIFLLRKPIYRTSHFRRLYERRARINLNRALNALRG